MERAVIYCRVSTKEQTQNLSLSTQESRCKEFCRRCGWQVDRVYIEKGESAKTTDRTEFQKLIGYCTRNKKRVQYLVVYSLSRFARNKYDHFVVRALLNRVGVTLRSVTEPVDETPSGKFMEGVLAATVQFDNDVRAERTIEGMKAALVRGKWTFQSPLGYRKISRGSGSPSMVADAVSGPLVQEAFRCYATGLYTKREVLRKVTALGLKTRRGKPLSPQTFENMLRNPVHMGRIVLESWAISCDGDWEPLVDAGTFRAVEKHLRRKALTVTRHSRNHPDFPLRRFVRCGKCSRPLTGSWSRGRSRRYPYYRCPGSQCRGVNVRKAVLEDRFAKMLEHIQPQPEYLGLFREIVRDVGRQQASETAAIRARLERRLEQLKSRQDVLVEAYVFERALDKATYQRQRQKLNEEIASVETEILDRSSTDLDLEQVLGFSVEVLSEIAQSWQDFGPGQKLRFQQVLFPKGLQFDESGFGTAETNIVFNYLEPPRALASSVASPAGFEPALPP
jgi:site-specific DNA recombinase